MAVQEVWSVARNKRRGKTRASPYESESRAGKPKDEDGIAEGGFRPSVPPPVSAAAIAAAEQAAWLASQQNTDYPVPMDRDLPERDWESGRADVILDGAHI